jgi:amino acid transporter
LAFLLATVGVILITFNINSFARESSGTASLYEYIARSLGATVGVLGAWALAIAYIGCGAACVPLFAYYFNALLGPLHVSVSPLLLSTLLLLGVWFCAWKDMRLSARLMLGIEFAAMAVGIALAAAILLRQGHLDLPQFQTRNLSFTGVGLGSVLAFMAMVGFESAASLGDEAHNPLRTIPRAIIVSSVIAGAYYVLHAYTMVSGFRSLPTRLTDSQVPLFDLAKVYGVSSLAWLLVFAGLVSGFTIVLASVNAGPAPYFCWRDTVFSRGLLPAFIRRIRRRAFPLQSSRCSAWRSLFLSSWPVCPPEKYGDTSGASALSGFFWHIF